MKELSGSRRGQKRPKKAGGGWVYSEAAEMITVYIGLVLISSVPDGGGQ